MRFFSFNRLKAVLIFTLLILSLYSNVIAQKQKTLCITNAVIIDGNGNIPIENGTIVIKGAKIDKVGSTSQVRIPSDAHVIDANGKTVMPGLADMHVHLMGGWDGNSVDMLGYQRYLNAFLYSGVTTILDLGNVLPYILQIRQEVKAGRIQGPRIYCVGPLVDGADPLWPPLSYSVSSIEQIPKRVRQLKSAGVDVIKAYVGLSDQMVNVLVSEAKKKSLPVFIHPRPIGRIGSEDIMKTGIAAFAHMATKIMSDDAMNLMKEKEIHCITTLTLFEYYSLRRLTDLRFLDNPLIKDTAPPSFLDALKAKFAKATQNPRYSIKDALGNAKKMFDAGILIVAGTDSPYPGVFFGESIHRELELLVESGLTPLEAISVATKNAALLMKAEEEWGTLATGKLANVIVIAGRPDRNISHTRNVEMVIKAGRIIDREKLKFDVEKDPGFRVIKW